MTIQQLDTAFRARPFVAFTLLMADGRTYHVPHPEYMARSPTGRTVTVYEADDTATILDLLLMTSIQFARPVSGETAA